MYIALILTCYVCLPTTLRKTYNICEHLINIRLRFRPNIPLNLRQSFGFSRRSIVKFGRTSGFGRSCNFFIRSTINCAFRAKKWRGTTKKKFFFPALCAGSVPHTPLLLWTSAPHFQIRSGATGHVHLVLPSLSKVTGSCTMFILP